MPAFGPCRRACGCAGLFFLPADSAVLSVFAASLFAPSFFPSSVFLPVFRLSLAGPHFPLPAFPFARISLCPCFSLPVSPSVRISLLPVFLSARISPALSVRPPSSVFRLVFLLSFLVFPFIVHRLPFVVRRPLRRSSSIACRLLSVARCAVHRPALAACCPSPIVYPLPPIVHPLPPVARNLPPAVHRPLRRPYPVAVPRLFPLPFGPDHGFCIRGIPACVSAGAACRVVPQRVPSVGLSAKMRPPPPYLGRRAVSDKITPCVLLSGAIFPARPAILLTIWQRLPFGTTFVQIQGVTGAPDPQGGRTPAATATS